VEIFDLKPASRRNPGPVWRPTDATTRRLSVMRMALLLALLASRLSAQTAPEFDAASIKPNNSVRKGLVINTTKSGDFTGQNVTLRNLIAYAYHLKEFQVTGGPKWVDADYYDVIAKPPRDGDLSDATNRVRMRALLADRFQLVIHTDTKELPVYALVVAKNGPHLEADKADHPRVGIERRTGAIVCGRVSMKDFAEWGLTPLLGNVVLDKTGLEGEFDLRVQYADDDSGPDLASALQTQLGLKLEPQKAPMPVIVVDRAGKATEN
jgi:uncharacterized protein (TIGR03435 family)